MAIIDRRGIIVDSAVPTTIADGQPVKSPCRVATTANITLNGQQTIDGVAVVEGDRVLVKNQSDATLNGIYDVSTGNWRRATDFDGAFDVVTGTRVYVTSGTVGSQLEYAVSTTGTITIDTTSISFVLMGGSTAPVSLAMKPVVAASTIPIALGLLGVLPAFADVKQFGAVGDGVTDDTTAFLNANASLTIGGILEVPPGVYLVSQTINLINNTTLRGAGRTASYIFTRSDITVIGLSALSQCNMENICIFGKGAFVNTPDTGTFGASNPAVLTQSSGGYMTNCTIQGGSFPLCITDAADAVFTNVDCSFGYGAGNVVLTGIAQNWYIRCKWDHDPQIGIAPTNAAPYPAWASATVYTVGHIVASGGYLILCSVAGTSGGVAPTLKNYGATITDGATVRWRLVAPSSYTGVTINDNAGENHFYQVDLSGFFSFSAFINTSASGIGGYGNTFFTDCTMSNDVYAFRGDYTSIQNCEVGAIFIVDTGYTGELNFSNNIGIGGAASVAIGVGVSNFVITNNIHLTGIAVGVGASDHYIISHNVGGTVVDGGTGVNKSVAGNVG